MSTLAIVVVVSIVAAKPSLADCTTFPEERKSIVIESCEAIIPNEHPRISGVMGNMPDDFDRDRIDTAYTGLVLVSAGAKYFISERIAQSCSTFSPAQAMEVVVQKACCDGDPNAHCLLGISEYISEYASEL